MTGKEPRKIWAERKVLSDIVIVAESPRVIWLNSFEPQSSASTTAEDNCQIVHEDQAIKPAVPMVDNGKEQDRHNSWDRQGYIDLK